MRMYHDGEVKNLEDWSIAIRDALKDVELEFPQFFESHNIEDYYSLTTDPITGGVTGVEFQNVNDEVSCEIGNSIEWTVSSVNILEGHSDHMNSKSIRDLRAKS